MGGSSNIAGIPELIIDHVNGYLVSPGDVSEMVVLCAHLINNKDLWQKFKQKSRAMVEDRFDEEKMVEKYADCFWRTYNDNLLGRNSS